MKILDPVAIREIDNSNLDIPIVITDMTDPRNTTIIQQDITTMQPWMIIKENTVIIW